MADNSTAYVLTAPMALVDTNGGTTVYVYRDGVLPADATQQAIEHLLAIGFITEAEQVGGLQTVRRGDGSLPDDGTPPAPDATEVDDVDGDGPIPPKSATKDVWVAYAVSKGMNPAEADAATKDDLIANYGAPVS